MFGIEKMPHLLAAKNKFILNIYDTYASKKFSKDFQENILGGVILI